MSSKGQSGDNGGRQALIAVMGPTGAGKSSFIAGITGADVKVCRTLHSGTSTIGTFPLKLKSGLDVTLVDTPGFDDTFNSDTDTLFNLATWLKSRYDEGQLLSGILYLQPITKNRVEGSTRRCLTLFQKLCGPQNLKHVILVTTFWNDVSDELGKRREEELVSTEGLWKELKQSGARVERMSRDYDRYHSVLGDLAVKPTLTLKIQAEMKDGKAFDQTSAGLHVDAEILKLKDEHEAKAQEMQNKFQRLMIQKESAKKKQRQKLKEERKEWEEREAARLKKEKEEQEERVRKMEAERERERKAQQARLDKLAKEAAKREAERKKRQKEEEDMKHQRVLDDARLKFRAGMLQQTRINNQLDVLRAAGQAGMVVVDVAGISAFGKGLVNMDAAGNKSDVRRTILDIFCDICRQPPGTQPYRTCTQTPCSVAQHKDYTFLVCQPCWEVNDYHLLHGKGCTFTQTQLNDACRRANNPNNLYCDACGDPRTGRGAIQGVYFHCCICNGDDFDICLMCVVSGKGCYNTNHRLLWAIQRVNLGNL